MVLGDRGPGPLQTGHVCGPVALFFAALPSFEASLAVRGHVRASDHAQLRPWQEFLTLSKDAVCCGAASRSRAGAPTCYDWRDR
eukprot:14565332-Alexandrium_andersonii.AAC.1